MKTISVLNVPSRSGTKTIELLLGDLSAIPPEHAVDVLVVSAFPHDYVPTRTSLIGALDRKGLSVAELAEHPEVDLRKDFSCWLSGPIQGSLNFQRILCFEPLLKGRPSEVVGDIFQALAPFTFAEPNITSVAMPIIAAGDQNQLVAEMLPALLDAAFNWLKQGFPVRTIKLVVYNESSLSAVRKIFLARSEGLNKTIEEAPRSTAHLKSRSADALPKMDAPPPVPPAGSQSTYDVFISYSRLDEEAAQHFYQCLIRSGLRVFIDRMDIKVGAAWQQTIFDALESCNVTAVLYSPSFLQSKVCKEEFNIAWMRRRELDREVLFPILIHDTALPTYMRMLNYLDCRVIDKPKMEAAASRLAETIRSPSLN